MANSSVSTIPLHVLDWVVVGIYVLLTIGIALRVRLGQKTARDYFLAGRSMPWAIVSISMFATLFSTVSFVAVPGEAFKHGVLLSLNSLGYAVFTPLAMWLFLRFFYSVNTYTAYEYLEHRFNGTTRTLGSLIFLVSRALYGGTVFYAAAKIFESLVGWKPLTTIVIIGILAVGYTTIGGLRAVMITDVLQMLVLLGGLLAIFFKASTLIDFDYMSVWKHAQGNGHAFNQVSEPEFFSFNPYVRYTIWVWLVASLLTPLSNYGTDQLVVQRLLSSKSYFDAKKAIWLKTFAVIPIMAAFYAVGLILSYYYQFHGILPDGFEADHVMGLFISQQLPTPIPGLITAALMAALMSTVDSTVGSLSTVTCKDFLERAGWIKGDDVSIIKAGKRLTLIWGVVVVGLALFLTRAGQGIESTVLEVAAIWGSLWGVLLVVMLGGVLTRFVTARAASVALIIGILVNIAAPWFLYYRVEPDSRISFAWVGIPGVCITALVMVIGSAFFGKRSLNLKNLMLWEMSDES